MVQSNSESEHFYVQKPSARLLKQMTDFLLSEKKIDHPIITQCSFSSTGLPAFAEGAPYLFPENYEYFINSINPDITLMKLDRARQIFRTVSKKEKYPLPESCTPYTDANSLGYYLKTVLPILFVRTTKGKPLLDARLAVKYLRENANKFRKELKFIEDHSRKILRNDYAVSPDARFSYLLTDIVQPYNAFTESHVSLRAGIWINTPEGINTIIGPPINNSVPFSVFSGSIETDWHHFELFIVMRIPEFEGQVYFIEPDQTVAQLYFISRAVNDQVELRFSKNDPGSNPEYWSAWEELGSQLIAEGKQKTVERHETSSVNIGCPHCFVSVTAAAEGNLPADHVFRRGFINSYKLLKQQYHKKDEQNVDEIEKK